MRGIGMEPSDKKVIEIERPLRERLKTLEERILKIDEELQLWVNPDQVNDKNPLKGILNLAKEVRANKTK
jgi:hypothetical protein